MSDKSEEKKEGTVPAADMATAADTATAPASNLGPVPEAASTSTTTSTTTPTGQGGEVFPELGPAERAFEVGDYVLVRKLTDELIAKPPTPEVAEAARALRRRTEVDPIQILVLALCLCLLLVIASIYVF